MNWLNYILPFIASLILALIFTPAVLILAKKYNLSLIKPRERDVHKTAIPRLGGVALFISFWLVIIGYLVFTPDKLHFVDAKILKIDQNLLGVILGSTLLLILGIVDDIKSVKPVPKLLWQIIAASLVVIFGIKIWWLSNPAGGANIILGNLTYIFVPLWIVLIINVMNWLDGLDGLADGVSFIALIILTILSLKPTVNQPATALLCTVLAGASLGFLFYNFNPAKIFLGDSGSMFLGFMIAVAAIISGGKIATALLVLGIPILDAFWVILRRIFTGKSPMTADNLHLHHRLLQAGLNQKQTVIVFYFIAALFGIFALQNGTQGKMIAGLWLVGIIVIMGIMLVVFKKSKIDSRQKDVRRKLK
ncbi:MAG: undecaprenyl/decaprenyl-phosphate alpha-N-acetylglucosaminyl 1-phosphate transferase [Patescibacteria group bacterium]|nr:undecaprenyl/decaprenyl-phosphate alpha-N-acetylglucosaminyl 1-phosphate transferase [Patescibacteria group bacterium]